MKKIILIRHAKSDWPEDTADFDRPLAERGLEDAVKMSHYLKEQGITIDKLVSSPALRALNTSKIFNKAFEVTIDTHEKLYNPSENNFLSVIYDLDDNLETVAFFSHNNGISNFANSMSEDVFHFPTCGVAGFEIACNSWADFDGADKKMIYFFEPKKL